jgi:excinuclease ABC subunit A
MKKNEPRIVIKGARVHNLKNVSLDVPKNKLVAFTGVSGSGKSSLAFDTIYAEGQRRYVESLSAYARQFLDQLDKPEVDRLDGLSPAISIDQKSASNNPRSTVGTVTEIQDYLRLMYANIGILHCPITGTPVKKQSVQDMFDQVKQWHTGRTILIMAPLINQQKGEFLNLFQDLTKQGFVRVRVDGVIKRLDECTRLAKQTKHTIELIIDRITNEEPQHPRLFEAIELAAKQSDGLVRVEDTESNAFLTLSEHFVSDDYQFSITELTPRLFSFNSPIGACATCNGMGYAMEFETDLLFSDTDTVMEVCEKYINFDGSIYEYRFHEDAHRMGLQLNMESQLKTLTKAELTFLIYGRYGSEIEIKTNRFRMKVRPRGWEGIVNLLRRRYAHTDYDVVKERYENLMVKKPCKTCHAQRLNAEALSVKINGLSIASFGDLPIQEAVKFIENLTMTDYEAKISKELRKEIINRLNFLNNVGLHYLTLNRTANTLSGGEHQRIRLATQIGSGLTGVLYVLDEPSIGLHQRDNQRLIETLNHLKNLGNTVIVVEHDEDTIKAADHVVDIGPHAGRLGGEIIHNGSLSLLLKNKASITGQYLSGRKSIHPPTKRRKWSTKKTIRLTGATKNNLKNVNVSIPLGVLTCVTGVSGSGKSTLIKTTLLNALLAKKMKQKVLQAPYKTITGIQHIDKVIVIDQSAIGRTPRSNPATYVGFFSAIRDVYSKLPESKINGFGPGRFSFNVKGGRCETCEGAGIVKIEMHFLSDIFVTCSTCKGQRFNNQTLRVKFKGHTINDTLNMTINQACEVFENIPAIHKKIKVLQEVGMGYITLGQSATTLSGGEAQRIKLAKELSKRSTGQTLYMLDEPTTGLHFDDINRLLGVLQQLVDSGNTVIVIEHNLDVAKCADHIIDMGPGGGHEGGQIVAKGTPEEIAASTKSETGKFLKEVLDRSTANVANKLD